MHYEPEDLTDRIADLVWDLTVLSFPFSSVARLIAKLALALTV